MNRWLTAAVLAGCATTAPAPAGHDGMAHRFEHADQWATTFDDPSRDEWQHPDDVLAALALAPGQTIADIGAGTGYFTVRLARAVPDGTVIATDTEPDMVRYLIERAAREQLGNVRALQCSAADPKLPAGGVDRVLIVDVWHHIADRPGYARALATALRPGGKIAIVDFTPEPTPHGPPHLHRLAREAVAADLLAAGLAVEPSQVALPEQYVVIATKR